MSIEEVNKVLQVLVNAITIAQSRGAYTLEEAASIHSTITSFAKKPEGDTPSDEQSPQGEEEEEK